MTEKIFTPAMGLPWLTPLYDSAIGLLTREDAWRSEMLRQVSATPEDRILDIGCGTGSLILRLKEMSPDAEIHGIDPDSDILFRARRKFEKSHVEVILHHGFVSLESESSLGSFSKIVSSLVLHQTPIEEKKTILTSMAKMLRTGGTLVIADYGLQRTRLMRALFRSTVQLLDGVKDTQPNANGCIPELMKETGFVDVCEIKVIPTLTGSISIYKGMAA